MIESRKGRDMSNRMWVHWEPSWKPLTMTGKKPALHLSEGREFQAQGIRRKKVLRQKEACHLLRVAKEEMMSGGWGENKVRCNRDGLAQYGKWFLKYGPWGPGTLALSELC